MSDKILLVLITLGELSIGAIGFLFGRMVTVCGGGE